VASTPFQVGDFIVHIADSTERKCANKDHGTITRVYEDEGMTFVEAEWRGKAPGKTTRTPIGNIFHCVC